MIDSIKGHCLRVFSWAVLFVCLNLQTFLFKYNTKAYDFVGQRFNNGHLLELCECLANCGKIKPKPFIEI